MRRALAFAILTACGSYPGDPRLPDDPLAACGEIIRQCYGTWRKCDTEKYPPCESRCAADYVYEDDIQACVERCYPCTRERISCMAKPSCGEAQKVCEDGAHVLAERYEGPAQLELVCLVMCAPGGSCDQGAQVCRELFTLADASRMREEGPVFACQ